VRAAEALPVWAQEVESVEPLWLRVEQALLAWSQRRRAVVLADAAVPRLEPLPVVSG